MYIVHLNYGTNSNGFRVRKIHLVRAPSGEGKTFYWEELWPYLTGKPWRYAQ